MLEMISIEKERLAIMKATLPNGVIVEGTTEQVHAVMRTFGMFVEDGLHYNSSTKGVIRIADMNDQHLKNAIRKLYQQEAQKLDSKLPNSQFVAVIRRGVGGTNVTLLGLLKELAKRTALE